MLEKISIIVPCYNEEDSLPLFYKAFLQLSKSMEHTVTFELLCINDGSQDNTLTVLRALEEKDARIKYISFSRNFGKEAAILAGLEHASGNYAIISDADLQDPLEMIETMYDAIKNEGYDCVAAKRVSRQGEPPLRSFLSNMFYVVINRLASVKIMNGARDFRLMTRQMVEAILELKEYNRFSKGLFSFVGFQTKWLEYEHINRVAGSTSWSLWSLFKYSAQGIFAFSTRLLHLASLLGLIVCFFSFLFIAKTIAQTLIWGEPVAGYPTLICIVTFLGGIQLFCVGISSEYISKIYSEVKRRPVYIIKSTNIKRMDG